MIAGRAGAQTKTMRRKLLATLALWLGLYVLAAGALWLFLEAFVMDDIGDAFADATSEWTIFSEDEVAELERSGNAAWMDENHQVSENYQVIEQPDGSVAVRDLTSYNQVKSWKYPVSALLFAIGFFVCAYLVARRPLAAFDEVSAAVRGMAHDRSRPVELSPDLAILQNDLNSLRESVLADGRAAAAAERRKNELVAYLAHDIRTPLTSILGYLSLLDEAPDLPEDQRRAYTATALAKAERLEGLIDEFFEITRYNLQSIPIERTHVDAKLFLEQVVDEFEPVMRERGLSASVAAPDGARLFIDPDKMARAVGNVVRNAVSYADENTQVKVAINHMTVGEDAQGTSYWRISVENQGREISPEHLRSVFDKFYREDGARRSSEGGAGLGLAIAREIVVAHGGTIGATSESGRTVFSICIPV